MSNSKKMNISKELKAVKVQFDEIRKQLVADSKKKYPVIDHHSMNPVKISKKLSKLLKIMPNTTITRASVYHKFYIYLIKKNLILPNNTFVLTERLESVLDLSNKETAESLSKKLKCTVDDVDQFIIKNNIHLANCITMLEHNFIE